MRLEEFTEEPIQEARMVWRRMGNKVKRAVIQDDEDIFERVDPQSIDYAVMDVISYFDENLNERQILMNLQESGWNAPQSRMLINMAKKKTR